VTGGGNQIAIMSATVNSLLAMKHKYILATSTENENFGPYIFEFFSSFLIYVFLFPFQFCFLCQKFDATQTTRHESSEVCFVIGL